MQPQVMENKNSSVCIIPGAIDLEAFRNFCITQKLLGMRRLWKVLPK